MPVSVRSGYWNKNTIDWVTSTTNTCFLDFWRLWSPRSRPWQVKAHFLVGRRPTSHCVFMWWKRVRKPSGVFFMRALISFTRALPHDLIISQKPHLRIPSHWGLGFQYMTQTFSPYGAQGCHMKSESFFHLLRPLPRCSNPQNGFLYF